MNGADGTDWLNLIGLIFQCGFPLIMIALGWFVGSTVERNHLRSLRRREQEMMTIPLTDLKTLPPGIEGNGGMLVTGSVVIGSDYFKTFCASLRKLIGGEIKSYERLMIRARGEAILRMMHSAHQLNAKAVINLRLETSSVGRMSRNPSPMVEVIAYGTAILGGSDDP